MLEYFFLLFILFRLCVVSFSQVAGLRVVVDCLCVFWNTPVVLDHVHPLAALLRPLLCPHVKVRFAHERFFVVIAEANS